MMTTLSKASQWADLINHLLSNNRTDSSIRISLLKIQTSHNNLHNRMHRAASQQQEIKDSRHSVVKVLKSEEEIEMLNEYIIMNIVLTLNYAH